MHPSTVLPLGLGAKPQGSHRKPRFWLLLVGRPEGRILLLLTSLQAAQRQAVGHCAVIWHPISLCSCMQFPGKERVELPASPKPSRVPACGIHAELGSDKGRDGHCCGHVLFMDPSSPTQEHARALLPAPPPCWPALGESHTTAHTAPHCRGTAQGG